MYSAEDYRRCLKLIEDTTELERKTIFSNYIYHSDSYLMGELVNIIPADKFIEAVREWKSRNKKRVTWIKTSDDIPEYGTDHYVKVKPNGKITAGHFMHVDDVTCPYLYGWWILLNGCKYPVFRGSMIGDDVNYSSDIEEWSLEPIRFDIEP